MSSITLKGIKQFTVPDDIHEHITGDLLEIEVDASESDVVIIVPASAGSEGDKIKLKNISTNSGYEVKVSTKN